MFIECVEPANLNAAGWLAWNVTPALYAEYNCTGPGSNTSGRAAFSRQLTSGEAATYTLSTIFSKYTAPIPYSANWIPVKPTVTGLKEGQLSNERIPTSFGLSQNFPNPFNPTTTITFSLPVSASVSLQVFNVLGKEVATLVNGKLSAGVHSYQWNAYALPSGIYFYRLQADNFDTTKKLTLVR